MFRARHRRAGDDDRTCGWNGLTAPPAKPACNRGHNQNQCVLKDRYHNENDRRLRVRRISKNGVKIHSEGKNSAGH